MGDLAIEPIQISVQTQPSMIDSIVICKQALSGIFDGIGKIEKVSDFVGCDDEIGISIDQRITLFYKPVNSG
jgi:hypothetical protein